MLFSGYVPTKDKKCLMPFKNKTSSELLSLSTASNFDEYAGILAENTILIDVDDGYQSDILFNIVKDKQLKCKVYETTRGKHFLFHNNDKVPKCFTKTGLACGLTADIKVGCKNSYSILKFNGVERKVLYDTEEYQEVPQFLLPIKSVPDFLNMSDGDGRNQTFFNYILTLQNEEFSNDEIRNTISLINQYVVKTSLEEKELEIILREEAFQKPSFFVKDKFLFDKFARYLTHTFNICKINGQLHIYKDGIYESGLKKIEAIMISIIPTLNKSKRSEVLDYLELIATENEYEDNADLIPFKNGIYDISSGSLLEFSPDYHITNKIPWDFNPEAKSELLEKTLSKIACQDEQIKLLLEEVVGYCFYRRNELRKSFILVGDKANGKSTYLGLINTLLGAQNVSNLDLSDLGNRFSPSSLFGVLANIGDDISDEFIGSETAAIYKKIVSGSRIRGERKGKDEFFFDPYCKMIYSANTIPRIRDKSGAVLDRMIIVPFDARFSKNDPDFDPYIRYKLNSQECIEALIQLAIKGLNRVLQAQQFTTSDKVKKQLTEYEENNHPILLFFKEVSNDEVVNNSTKDVYKKYSEFCIFNNYTPMSHSEFSKQITKYYSVVITQRRINGVKTRIFVPQ